MPINFILNDPRASVAAFASVVSITPTPSRPATRSGIAVGNLPVQALYPVATPSFVAWQAREAALRAIVAVEAAFGPLPGWTGKASNRKLPLIPVEGQDLNAYYDRTSVSFFVTSVAGANVYSGASTDVVAHEVGHAILDAIRPDLWNVNMMEADAFHEGFGDIVAIHTALTDRGTRQRLLAIGMRQPNFVEATAEDLSAAIRAVYGANSSASAPRRALNTHRWSFPQSLPRNGPPDVLINESHSLGQLASGVYYDLLCALYQGGGQGEAGLLTAVNATMKLVMDAIVATPIRPRFFESWGRSMVAVAGPPRAALIVKAFGDHGIMIGGQPAMPPRVRLANPTARRTRGKQMMTPTAKSKLRSAMGFAPGERLSERQLNLGGEAVVEISAARHIDLTGLSERLEGVRATVNQPALVAEVDATAAIVGAVDSEFALSEEVRAYVATLIAHDAIAWDGSKPKAGGKEGRSVVAGGAATHRIVTKGGTKFLERRQYSCGCRTHQHRSGDRSGPQG